MEVPEWAEETPIDDAVALVMNEMLGPDTVIVQDSISIRLSAKGALALSALQALPLARRKDMLDHFRVTIYGELRAGVIKAFGVAPTKERANFMSKLYTAWIKPFMMLDTALGSPSLMDRVMGLAPDREAGT